MKKLILSLILFSVVCSSVCYADTVSMPKSTLKWTPSSPSSVSAKANSNSAYGLNSPAYMQDPMMTGMMQGYMNMMQGMTGNNYTNMQEIQRQQMDYAKQQSNNMQQQEED